MSDPGGGSPDSAALDALADDFLARRRGGEDVSIESFAAARPALASEILELFPTLLAMEDVAAAGAIEQIGPYRILRELGRGGMGVVYLAEGPAGRAAVKVVHPRRAPESNARARFLREIEVGRSIRHTNVVATFDAGEETLHGAPLLWLAMEYVEGDTLRSLLGDLGRVPEALCRHVGREVAKGLAAMHAAGVVHRDLKPDNVLITRAHVVRVMDLGLARLVDATTHLSQTGAFVGTLRYAAPEQLEGVHDAIDGRTDLYALGVTLYELATGRNPIVGEDVATVAHTILNTTPRRAGELNPQLSPFFEEMLAQLLERDRAKRIRSAADLAQILEAGDESKWWRVRSAEIRATTRAPLRRIHVPREAALVGRDAEIAGLRAVFAHAAAGAGQVVLVEGEAGIGKSRLVDEFVAGLRREGEDFNFLFGDNAPGGAATGPGAFSTAYREHFGVAGIDAALRLHLSVSPGLVPAFAALLRCEPPPGGAAPLTKGSLQTAFVRTTQSLAAERVTVVCIDDLHFAPEEGRALFAAIALSVPEHRVLLIGTARAELDEQWVAAITRPGHVTRVPLPRLGPADLGRLLADALRSESLALEIAGRIGAKSDGNPYFAFEILRDLRDQKLLTQRPDGVWIASRRVGEIRTPSTIQDLIEARIAGLDDDDVELLRVAACVGFEFDPLLVGAVAERGPVPTLRRFAAIEMRHRLVRSAGRRYVFDHHQVQEVLYAGMSELLREEYHGAIGDALDRRVDAAGDDARDRDGALGVDVCEHFLKSARGERGLPYLEAALTHLEAGYLNARSVALAERALAVPGLLEREERAKALLRLCATDGPLYLLGNKERQEEAAREAERLAGAAGDEELLGQAAAALGRVFLGTSRHEEAEASLRMAREIASSLGDEAAAAVAENTLATVFLRQGQIAKSREGYERALAVFRQIKNRQGEAMAADNLASALQMQGKLAEVREHREMALTICREIGNRAGEAAATVNLGILFSLINRLAEAREYFERGLALSREIGHREFEVNATCCLGITCSQEGRLGEAERHIERALAMYREIGSPHGEANAEGNLGSLLQKQGRLVEAREHIERHLAISREIGDRRGQALALHNLGCILLLEGVTTAAKERQLAALAICDEIGDRSLALLVHASLGVLHVAAGEEDLARSSFTGVRDEASKMGMAGAETIARCRLAGLAGGDVEDAERSFAANEKGLAAERRLLAHWLLWEASGKRSHLAEAKRLLDEALANAPDDISASMLANVGLHREIAAAAEKARDTSG